MYSTLRLAEQNACQGLSRATVGQRTFGKSVEPHSWRRGGGLPDHCFSVLRLTTRDSSTKSPLPLGTSNRRCTPYDTNIAESATRCHTLIRCGKIAARRGWCNACCSVAAFAMFTHVDVA